MSATATTVASTSAPVGVSASLYVGDLHPDVSETTLYDTFNEIGPVASVRVCRDTTTRQSLGYGYVNYQLAEDAERALTIMNNKSLNGRFIRVMWSQRDPTLRKSNVGNIFIKSLSPSVDNQTLHDTFSVFGNILSCKVASGADGKPLGYGFVHYELEESALRAIEKVNGKEIEGVAVVVEPFRSKTERGGVEAVKFTNVYAKNFPLEWTEEDLNKFFSQFGEITSTYLAKNEDGSSKGFAFLNFATPSQAVAAVKANDTPVGTPAKNLYVSRAKKADERSKERKELDQVRRQEIQKKSAGVNLYVKNLGDEVDDLKLKEMFEVFGTITSVRVQLENGRSRGFGFVCFSNNEEATKAFSEMNGRLINGKPLYVSFHQPKAIRQSQLATEFNTRKLNTYNTTPYQQRFYMYPPSRVPNSFQLMPVANMRPRAEMRRRPHMHQQPIQRPSFSQILASVPEEKRKRCIGDNIFPLVVKLCGEEHAPKITGMLLEMDNNELLRLIDNKDELRLKVEEAIRVLSSVSQ